VYSSELLIIGIIKGKLSQIKAMGNCCHSQPETTQDIKPAGKRLYLKDNTDKTTENLTESDHQRGSKSRKVSIGDTNDLQENLRRVFDINVFEPHPDIVKMAAKYGIKELDLKEYSGKDNPFKLIDQKNELKYFGQVASNGTMNGIGQMATSNLVHVGYFKNNMKSGPGRTFLVGRKFIKTDWSEDEIVGTCEYHDDELGHSSTIHYKDGVKCGSGEEFWADGTTFRGSYKDGVKEGEGEMVWADGNSFKGQFSQGYIHGHGVYKWVDGKMYDGEWEKDKMHGKGVFTWPDGRKYEGYYKEDLKDGQGTFYWSPNKRYEGEWVKGKQHGQGKFVGENGEVRVGRWENGALVG
jgi:hypothetical protein